MEVHLYTVSEFAAAVRVSPSLVYKLVEERRIEHLRFGSKVMFSEQQLKKFIEASTVQSVAAQATGRG